MNEQGLRARLGAALAGARCSGGVSESTVQNAEARLNVHFPPGLRLFLREFGAAYGSGCEIFGLPRTQGSTPPEWSHLVNETLAYRRVAGFPPSYIQISHDGVECAYFIDTAGNPQDDSHVVVALEPGRDYEIVAGDFLEFVERRMRRARL